MDRLTSTSLALIASASLTGCATGGQKLTNSGFLAERAPLAKAEGHGNTAFQTATSYQPDRYRSVVVDEAEWRAPARSPEVQDRLRRELRAALMTKLAERYRVVAKSSDARTLRVRSAITNVRRTRWYVNAPAQVASSLTFGTISLFAPLQGGASTEIQIEDASSGAVVAQMAVSRTGSLGTSKAHTSPMTTPASHSRTRPIGLTTCWQVRFCQIPRSALSASTQAAPRNSLCYDSIIDRAHRD